MIFYRFFSIKRVCGGKHKPVKVVLYMFNRCSKKEKCRILIAHSIGLMAGGAIICTLLCCRKKRTPADKIKRAFKELEEKLEV